jgi:two-component system nitrogen regulation response regulator NtrX
LKQNFWIRKGAFTNAFTRKIGKLELADKGTLFLDEVADMSLSAQAKLLRVLEEKEFSRLGSNTKIKVI